MIDWRYVMRYGFTGAIRRWWAVHVLGFAPTWPNPVFKFRLAPDKQPKPSETEEA
jgi:hypothetical protein